MSQSFWDNQHKDQSNFTLSPHRDLIRFENILRQNNGSSILDMGCGDGRNIIELAQKGFEITGIDFSPAAVEIAQKRLKEKNLIANVYVSDIFEKVRFIEDESFDGIIASDAVHYVEIEKFTQILKEMNRILKTGGLIFLTVPSEKAIIEPEKLAELFFTKEQIEKIITESFNIKYFGEDNQNHFVIIASEK